MKASTLGLILLIIGAIGVIIGLFSTVHYNHSFFKMGIVGLVIEFISIVFMSIGWELNNKQKIGVR